MPPISLHMVLARSIAAGLEAPVLDQAKGAYLLGATTPDIRVLTRQDRFSTHFFDLSIEDHQDSVGAFLAEHPQMANPADLSDETRAFVAGYISHLVFDEQYITGMYRRYFAQHEALGGQMRANVMDRLLQFDLDRTYCNDEALKGEICAALAGTVTGIAVGFIDAETLDRWRKVSADVIARQMDWDRMRGMITNHLRFGGLEEGETMSTFLDSLPELLDETVARITSIEIDAFVGRATETAARAVENYLTCG